MTGDYQCKIQYILTPLARSRTWGSARRRETVTLGSNDTRRGAMELVDEGVANPAPWPPCLSGQEGLLEFSHERSDGTWSLFELLEGCVVLIKMGFEFLNTFGEYGHGIYWCLRAPSRQGRSVFPNSFTHRWLSTHYGSQVARQLVLVAEHAAAQIVIGFVE